MAWRVYKSTDSSAPVLTGEVGSIIKLLDAVLVEGYGSKTACGWSRHFEDAAQPNTTIVVYRNGASALSRMYLRVNDAGGTTVGPREAQVRGFQTMVDNVEANGTYPFPTSAQRVDGNRIGKSNTADNTPRAWIAFGDSRTFVLLTQTYLTRWEAHYFGDTTPLVDNDAYCALVYSCPAGGAVNPNGHDVQEFPNLATRGAGNNYYTMTRPTYGYTMGTHTQAPQSLVTWLIATSAAVSTVDSQYSVGYGILPKVNPLDGAVYLCKKATAHDPDIIRGWLRGCFTMPHVNANWDDGEQFDGWGDFAGKRFVVYGLIPSATLVGNPVYHRYLNAFEISDTVS